MMMVACTDDGGANSGGGNSGNGGGNSGGSTLPQASLTVSATSADFATEGGEVNITINSSAAWTASLVNNRADDWCMIDPSSGGAGSSTLTIATTANDAPDDRTASVIIKSGELSKTIAVSQKQKDALTVTSSKFEVEAEGGEIEIEVKANIDFEYTIDESAKEWLTYQSTRAMKTSTLVFAVAQNEDCEKREGKITIKSGEFSEEITVYQAGEEPTIVVSQYEYNVSADGETITVEVKSNVDVAVEIPSDVDWITENTTRAISTNTYYFDVKPNSSYQERWSDIYFSNNAEGISDLVVVVQEAKELPAVEVAANEIWFAVDADTDEKQVHSQITSDWGSNVEKITPQYGGYTLTLKEGHSTIPDGAFSNMGIVAVVMGNAIKSIGDNAFNNCSLMNVTIPDSVTSIGFSAFKNCSFTSITIPDSVTSIGEGAFCGCYGLKSVTIPDSVTSIGEGAFTQCNWITSFNGKYASIDNRCLIVDGVLISFARAKLDSYTIPDGVNKIGKDAFYNCYNLTSVTIPNSVTSIGSYAFYFCSQLASVTIPDSVTSIGESAFLYCGDLTSITLPDSVTEIGASAFSACGALTSVVIGSGVTEFGAGAFGNCSSLTSVTISNGVTEIGESAFEGCTALTNVIIPDSATSIGKYAFLWCDALASVTIGSGVAEIGYGTFSDCCSLTEVYCKAITPPNLGYYVFSCDTFSHSLHPKIYVPASSLDAYQKAWEEYSSNIQGYYY